VPRISATSGLGRGEIRPAKRVRSSPSLAGGVSAWSGEGETSTGAGEDDASTTPVEPAAAVPVEPVSERSGPRASDAVLHAPRSAATNNGRRRLT
jgi:hypothetical protein